MKKIVLVGFLIILFSQYNVFAKEPLNSKELSKQIKEVKGHLISINIKLAESIMEELNSATDPEIIFSLKNIQSFTTKYIDFLGWFFVILLIALFVFYKI